MNEYVRRENFLSQEGRLLGAVLGESEMSVKKLGNPKRNEDRFYSHGFLGKTASFHHGLSIADRLTKGNIPCIPWVERFRHGSRKPTLLVTDIHIFPNLFLHGRLRCRLSSCTRESHESNPVEISTAKKFYFI